MVCFSVCLSPAIRASRSSSSCLFVDRIRFCNAGRHMRQKNVLTFTADDTLLSRSARLPSPVATLFSPAPGIHTQCHGFFAQRQTLIPDRNSLFTLTQRTLRLIQGFEPPDIPPAVSAPVRLSPSRSGCFSSSIGVGRKSRQLVSSAGRSSSRESCVSARFSALIGDGFFRR